MTDKETRRLIEEKEARERVKRLNAVIGKVLAGMKPPDDLTVTEWAEQNRRLSAESAAEPGPWRTERTPYLREPMNAWTDPKIRHIVMVAASQVGKSEFLNNCIGYVIDQDPGSILFVHPTTIDAKEYSKLRIAPMIRDCPTLRKKVSDPKSRDSGNTILQKDLPWRHPHDVRLHRGPRSGVKSLSAMCWVTSATAGRRPPVTRATRGSDDGAADDILQREKR